MRVRLLRSVLLKVIAAGFFAAAFYKFRRQFFPLFPRSSASSLEAAVLLRSRAMDFADMLHSPRLSYDNATGSSTDMLYHRVTRTSKGTLLMAFYFPQYHTAPENKLQLKVKESHYTDWDVLKANSDRASLTPLRYYNLAEAEIIRSQDEMANEYGVGVFIFYHYWLDNTMVLNLPLDLFIQRRRKTKFLLCWNNESGFLGKQLYDSPEKHGYQLLRYFLSENYLTDVHGRKPFLVYLTNQVDVAYLSRLVGFLDVNGIHVKLGHNYQHSKNNWALPEWSEIASEFAPHFRGGPGRPDLYQYVPRDPSWETGSEYWQGAITSWDSRPRCNSLRTHQKMCNGRPNGEPNGQVSPVGFGKLLENLAENFHPLNVDKIITIFAWNEWAEGAALEESKEHGKLFLQKLLSI